MEVAIIKYNAGNIRSVLYALDRIGIQATVTDDHEAISRADKIIFPGVGEASSAMDYLMERKMDQLIKDLKQPVLGICLGMQLMCRFSAENHTPCLGIFDEEVKYFGSVTGSEEDNSGKVPQIGWNTISGLQSGLFEGVAEDSYCYFVHGYYAATGQHTIAHTQYRVRYSSALHRKNFYGVQFHPEKSAATGEKILSNFFTI